MTEKLTIRVVKEWLNQIEEETDERFIILQQDERKGVKTAIQSWRRQKEKALKLEENYQRMLEFEHNIWQNNLTYIAGIDEVGRGPLAGPVVTAAVILPQDFHILEINDSKQLSENKREELYEKIKAEALAIGIGIKDEAVIDDVNIYEATKLAMIEAIENLTIEPEYLLIDAMELEIDIPQSKLIKGDARSLSIAAASIIAKVTRDRMMKEYAKEYPGYGFEKNAGYGTKTHLEGLSEFGVTPIHRKTFAPIKYMI